MSMPLFNKRLNMLFINVVGYIGGSCPSCWEGPSLLFWDGQGPNWDTGKDRRAESRGPKGRQREWGSWRGGRQPPAPSLPATAIGEHCKPPRRAVRDAAPGFLAF